MSTQTARGLAAGQTDEERIERYLSLNPDFFERTSRCSRACACRTCAPAPPSRWSSARWKCCANRRTRSRSAASPNSSPSRAPTTRSPEDPSLHAPPAARAQPGRGASTRSKPACAKTSTPSIPCCCSPRPVAVARRRRGRAFLRKLPADDANIRTLRSAARHRQAALRPDARHAARFPVRPRKREHRLGGAGAAGRNGTLGLLALGSAERERFHPGMSTEFLERMGELISDALSRP